MMARKKCYKKYSTHNEGKFVIAERFIKHLKSKIYDINIKKCLYW